MNDAISLLADYLKRLESSQPGQQSRLAKHLNVTPALVHQWLKRIRPIAPRHARGIEAYTGGAVSVHLVAPDVFGPQPLAAVDRDDACAPGISMSGAGGGMHEPDAMQESAA